MITYPPKTKRPDLAAIIMEEKDQKIELQPSVDPIDITTCTFERNTVAEVTVCSDYEIREFLNALADRDKFDPIDYKAFILIFILKTLLNQESVKKVSQSVILLAQGTNVDMEKVLRYDILTINAKTKTKTYYSEKEWNLSPTKKDIKGWSESSPEKPNLLFIVNLKLIREIVHGTVPRPKEEDSESEEVCGD